MSVFRIIHITKYEYDKPVHESVNEIRIFPYLSPELEVLQHELIISHHPDVHVFKDYWGNKAGLFSIVEPHLRLAIESRLLIRLNYEVPGTGFWEPTWQQLNAEIQNKLQHLELTRPELIEKQDQIKEICNQIFDPQKSVASIVQECNKYIYENFTYSKGITTIETTIDEIMEIRSGVCQDFAHLMLQILRTMDIPCRYVSGYICPHKNGMRGEGATHAWVEAWLPGYGWAGIDPTNNVWVEDKHVKLAVGRNFTDCSVVKGSYKGTSRQDLFVYVSVGYEDGMTFEETNRVQMEKIASAKEREEIQAQQQQQ
ncbi:MAG: transglutaminase domain-containing protein [Sphingobacteriales bacterium]